MTRRRYTADHYNRVKYGVVERPLVLYFGAIAFVAFVLIVVMRATGIGGP